MTRDLYRRIIESFVVGDGTIYHTGKTCNIFATDVCDALQTPLKRQDNGRAYDCQNLLSLLSNIYLSWRPAGFGSEEAKNFQMAQMAANTGKTVVAITHDHIALVRPNESGSIPNNIKDVSIAQAGESPSTNTTIAWGWPEGRHNEIEFYIWQGTLMSNADAEEYLRNKGA